MKAFVVLFLIPLVSSTIRRRYDPREELHSKDFIFYEDENGQIQREDLRLTEGLTTRTDENDATFFLHSRNNPEGYVIPGNNFKALLNYPFDSTKDTLFISHGWHNNQNSAVNVHVKAAALQANDINVFVVDWDGPASSLYTVARMSAKPVGLTVGQFMEYLIENFHMSADQFMLVGHSLGAHVAGIAGAYLNGTVRSITGLDPASPLYSLSDLDDRLDSTDAKFVEVIHTSAGSLSFDSSLGDVDYYPNGGRDQPGCGFDIVHSCAHSRSYLYYAESILTSGFYSHLCDNYNSYTKGDCRNNPESLLGELYVDQRTLEAGDFYLNTAESEPFALGETY